MIFKTCSRFVASIFAILIGAGSITTATAQDDRDSFYSSGAWQVKDQLISCELSNQDQATGSVLRVARSKSKGPELAIMFGREMDGLSPTSEAFFKIDTYSSPATIRFKGRFFVSEEAADSWVPEFRRGRRIALVVDRETKVAFSLAGSAKGMDALQRCVDQLTEGPLSRPIAVPVYRQIREPDLEGPFPPDRHIQPIMPGLWVTPNDFPRLAMREGREGTTRFRADVGKDGVVTSCAVTGSSGHSDLDEAACKIVSDRARFEPATDAESNLIGGTWESAIRWQIPT